MKQYLIVALLLLAGIFTYLKLTAAPTRVSDYIVVEGVEQLFKTRMTLSISQGYIPQGGVTVVGNTYYQALVKP